MLYLYQLKYFSKELFVQPWIGRILDLMAPQKLIQEDGLDLFELKVLL